MNLADMKMDLMELFETLRANRSDVERIKESQEEIHAKLDECLDRIHMRNNQEFLDDFVPLDIALAKLNMSKRTLDGYREKGQIGYIKVGKKIMLLKRDIEEFLMTHYVTKL